MQTDEVARRDRPIEAQSPLLSHRLASSNCTRRRHTHDDDDNDDVVVVMMMMMMMMMLLISLLSESLSLSAPLS